MGNIKFRFKSGNIVDKISFDGEFISVGEIKRWIANKFSLNGDPIKQLTLTSQENMPLKDELYKIISNSEVIVSRSQNHIKTISERTPINFELIENDLDSYNKKDPFVQPNTLSLITQEEESLLKHHLFNSGSSLYSNAQPNREKICRYCKETGHVTRNCQKVSVIQTARVVRGVPSSQLVSKNDGLLCNHQGCFGEIIANEDTFVKDFKNRFGDSRKDKKGKNNFNNVQYIKSCKKKDFITPNLKTLYDTSKPEIIRVFSDRQNKEGCFLESATVINTSSKCICLFCGKATHIWQKCPFRMAQLEDILNSGTSKKYSIDKNLPQDSYYLGSLFQKRLFFPPMLLQFMPKGENDLVIYAFGMKKLFDKKKFFRLKEEVKFQYVWKQILYNTLVKMPKIINTRLHKPTPFQPIWFRENLIHSNDMKPYNQNPSKYCIKQSDIFTLSKNKYYQDFRHQSSQSKNDFRVVEEKEYYNEVEKLVRKNKKNANN